MSDEIMHEDCKNGKCTSEEMIKEIKESMLQEEVLYDIADFFKVFGDSTRLKILCALLKGEVCVCDLAESLQMNQSAISHQLRVLRQNDLVKFRKEGKMAFYSLDDDHVSLLLEQGIEHILHKKVY